MTQAPLWALAVAFRPLRPFLARTTHCVTRAAVLRDAVRPTARLNIGLLDAETL